MTVQITWRERCGLWPYHVAQTLYRRYQAWQLAWQMKVWRTLACDPRNRHGGRNLYGGQSHHGGRNRCAHRVVRNLYAVQSHREERNHHEAQTLYAAQSRHGEQSHREGLNHHEERNHGHCHLQSGR